VSLAENRVVVGVGKQGSKGTAAAASTFPRWGDGTQFQPDLKTEDIREGDGTVSISRVIKNLQFWKGKIVHAKARAIDFGSMLKGVCGTASDVISGTAKNGTIASSVAGATSLTYTAVVGGAPVATTETYIIDQGLSTQEAVTPSAVSGGGPYTLTVPATKFAHGAAAPATVVMTHTFTPQFVRDWYTLWPQYQLGTPEALKIVDAQFHSMSIEGDAGKVLNPAYEYTGLSATDDTSAMTASYDASSAPFHYTNGVFKIDGSTGGNTAPFIKKFKVDHKHPLDDTMQTEAITLADFVSTIRQVDVDFDVLWQDYTLAKRAYLGGATGTTDSAFIGTGSLDFLFYPGGDPNSGLSFEIVMSAISFKAAMIPDPKLAGKALIQNVKATATGGTEVSYILKNTQQTAF
jgi:hypothetical protein